MRHAQHALAAAVTLLQHRPGPLQVADTARALEPLSEEAIVEEAMQVRPGLLAAAVGSLACPHSCMSRHCLRLDRSPSPTILRPAASAQRCRFRLSSCLLAPMEPQVLRSMYGPNIPRPVAYHQTRWAAEPLIRGSYSYFRVSQPSCLAVKPLLWAIQGAIQTRVS